MKPLLYRFSLLLSRCSLTSFAVIISPVFSILFSASILFSSEIFDPFSMLEDYLRYHSELKESEGEITFYTDYGFLRGPEEGETRIVLMISIPESELRFHKSEETYFCKYRISVYWKDLESGEAREKVWDRQYDRSGKIGEENAIHTMKTVLSLQKGRYKFEVEVEDKNARQYSQGPFEVDVPEFPGEAPSLSSIFLHSNMAETGKNCGETSINDVELKGMRLYSYSKDMVAYYIEIYGASGDSIGSSLRVSVVDSSGTEIWSEEKVLPGTQEECASIGEIGIRQLDLGEYRFRVSLLDSDGDIVSSREKPFYVSSSDNWIEDNFEDVIEYLSYIARGSEMEELKSAPPERRLEEWRKFWERRDPLPSTPVNESLVEYYKRLQYVNRYFTTHIEKGWKTDRGRVYLTLGPPDEAILREGRGIFGTWEVWSYYRSVGFRTILYFEDRGFTDDYRLVNPGAFIRAKSKLE